MAQENKKCADNSNRKLVILKSEEVDSLMFNVKEKVPRLRIVIYKLLGKVWLENIGQLNILLDMTVRNLSEFGDECYIYEMCKHIGDNNCELIKKNICSILQIADVLYV